MLTFTLEREFADGARAGRIMTQSGEILTPAFIPVATQATLKGLTPLMARELGAEALLANAYHLFLRPGSEVIAAAGGLAKFMGWPGPTFTDSGGFQVLSFGSGYKKVLDMTSVSPAPELHVPQSSVPAETSAPIESHVTETSAPVETSAPAESHVTETSATDTPTPTQTASPVEKSTAPPSRIRWAKVDENGVTFKSYVDGSLNYWTPEDSMRIQYQIGADIIFAFDELTSLQDPYSYQLQSVERTSRWAARCRIHHDQLDPNREQALFGVIQGANFADLRRLSAQAIADLDFEGYGYGGALEKSRIGEIIHWINAQVSPQKPRHLLGIADIDDLFTAVEAGIDTFDCVAPARVARNGAVYTKFGRFNVHRAPYVRDFSPIEPDCACYTCQNFTRAYLNHLIRAHERLGGTLLTIHNEYFIVQLVARMRQHILDGTFARYKADFLNDFY